MQLVRNSFPYCSFCNVIRMLANNGNKATDALATLENCAILSHCDLFEWICSSVVCVTSSKKSFHYNFWLPSRFTAKYSYLVHRRSYCYKPSTFLQKSLGTFVSYDGVFFSELKTFWFSVFITRYISPSIKLWIYLENSIL